MYNWFLRGKTCIVGWILDMRMSFLLEDYVDKMEYM